MKNKKIFDKEGDIKAGIKVLYNGKIYETGNRYHMFVELYHENGLFFKTVYQKEIKIV